MAEMTESTTGDRPRPPRRSAAQTRDLLLEAGRRVAVRATQTDVNGVLLNYVRVADVLAEATAMLAEEHGDTAPLTTGAMYQIWSNQTEFRQDLAAWIIELGSVPEVEAVNTLAMQLMAERVEFWDLFTAVTDRALDAILANPLFQLLVSFSPLSGHTQIGDAIVGGYLADREANGPMLQAMLAYGRRQVREGTSMDEFHAALVAVHEGLALRALVDPATVFGRDRAVARRLLRGTVEAFTEPIDGAP